MRWTRPLTKRSSARQEALQQYLGDEYVVVINFKKEDIGNRRTYNTLEIPGFSKVIPQGISVRALMMAADILVGDYRDEFFEAPLLHKPTFSTADDYEIATRVENMALNGPRFEQFLFCPVVASAEELVNHIRNLDEYDYAPMEVFREKMFTGCDGHSVERVVEYLCRE